MMFVEKSLGPSLVELCLIQAFDLRTSVTLDSQISPRSSGPHLDRLQQIAGEIGVFSCCWKKIGRI